MSGIFKQGRIDKNYAEGSLVGIGTPGAALVDIGDVTGITSPTLPGVRSSFSAVAGIGWHGPEASVAYNRETNMNNGTLSVSAGAGINTGQGVFGGASVVRKWEYPQDDKNRIDVRAGLSAEFTRSATNAVVGVRGDYIRNNGRDISPYATAYAGTDQGMIVGAGACMTANPDKIGVKNLPDVTVCAGGEMNLTTDKPAPVISLGMRF